MHVWFVNTVASSNCFFDLWPLQLLLWKSICIFRFGFFSFSLNFSLSADLMSMLLNLMPLSIKLVSLFCSVVYSFPAAFTYSMWTNISKWWHHPCAVSVPFHCIFSFKRNFSFLFMDFISKRWSILSKSHLNSRILPHPHLKLHK